MSSRTEPNFRRLRRPNRGCLLVCAMVAASASAGCRNTRYDECRAFVYAVNTRLVEIDRLTTQSPSAQGVEAADMRHLSELYAQLATKVNNLAISGNELQQLRDQYRSMVSEAAELARGIADSLESKDLDAAMRAHERFSSVISREDELVSRVNAYCRDRP